MRKEYVPVNLSDEAANDGQDVELQGQSTAHAIPATTVSTKTTANGEPILLAVAVPNTIRPPQVIYNEDEQGNWTFGSFFERACILIFGLLLANITFFESLVLLVAGILEANWFETLLGLIWFGATLVVLVGTFIGAWRRKWKLLVPGLVLQYFIGILIRLFVTELPEENDNSWFEGVE